MKNLINKSINYLFYNAKPNILNLILLLILSTFYLLFLYKSEDLNLKKNNAKKKTISYK